MKTDIGFAEVAAIFGFLMTLGALIWNARGQTARFDVFNAKLEAKFEAVTVSLADVKKSIEPLCAQVQTVCTQGQRLTQLERTVENDHQRKLAEHTYEIQQLTVTLAATTGNHSVIKKRSPSGTNEG